jgi:hypothetical protein
MRILRLYHWVLLPFIVALPTSSVLGQNVKNSSKNESKFEQLLAEKRKINNIINSNDRYKIQIFSGESEKAKKIILQFKQEFYDIESTIIFNTPNYKVWVGNFKTRMEAERNLAEIKKKYKNVLLIKPIK